MRMIVHICIWGLHIFLLTFYKLNLLFANGSSNYFMNVKMAQKHESMKKTFDCCQWFFLQLSNQSNYVYLSTPIKKITTMGKKHLEQL
jgi:hypothetical protein